MTALRPALASVLLAVLAVGGVVLPAVHHAAHGLEVAEARDAHAADHGHGTDGGPSAEAPCPPAPSDVDCAVCVGLTAASVPTASPAPQEGASDADGARADWIGTTAAAGAGARAPPVA